MIPLLSAAQTAGESLSMDAVKLEKLIDKLIDLSIAAGKHILLAVVILVVGRLIVNVLNRLVARMLDRRKVDPTIQTFLKSLVNILLMVLLVVSVIGALGINTTSFAALLASAGVAVGMALSGQLQNLAGGIIVLFFRPYKVGDWIEAQGVQGKVTAIQIFHTILTMVDNKVVYVPNGVMSSGVVVNYNRNDTRRVEWVIGIDYGEDTARAEAVVREVIAADKRILDAPTPYVAVQALDASSVNLVARVWVKTPDYWDVSYDTNRRIYDAFNKAGINFPFPQQTIHVVKD